MQRVRPLVILAVLAVLGTSALTGCRSEPDVAAYVGDRRYSTEDVDALAEEGLKAKVSTNLGQVRQVVLSWLVISDVGARVAKEKGITLERVDVTEVERSAGLPAGSPLARLFVDTSAVVSTFQGKVAPIEPTEADQREVFNNLSVNGGKLEESFEEVKPYLTMEAIGGALAVRTTLQDAIKGADVTVNPRYAPLVYPVQLQIGQVNGWVSIPLGDAPIVSGKS